VLDKQKLIDLHYYSLASKATVFMPSVLDVVNTSKAAFEVQFGISWDAVLEDDRVYNAQEACQFLGLDAEGLDREWTECRKAKQCIKLGDGFYCGLVEPRNGKPPIYVINGFYMAMRATYTVPGQSIYYYNVEWRSGYLSWADFKTQVSHNLFVCLLACLQRWN